ncbi:MAG: ketoacyl-ACP synthase III [Actinomycetes bacterium]
MEARTGVFSRHIAAPEETALDLALAACRNLIRRNPELHALVDGIVFCTQSPDYIMPPNSCVLHRELGLRDGVFAFDTNLACSGFVYSLALARGLIAIGTCSNILLVTADTYSRYINPKDRSARSLFGDGAAVTWVRSATDPGVLDLICETSGKGFEKFYIPAGGARKPLAGTPVVISTDASGNARTAADIHMDGMGVLSFVNSKVPGQIRRLLDRNSVSVTDIDLFIFHQASKLALDSLARLMKLPEDRVYRNLETIGNTVSASIPISIAQARCENRINIGDLVLLSGFGVGLSWGSALVRM